MSATRCQCFKGEGEQAAVKIQTHRHLQHSNNVSQSVTQTLRWESQRKLDNPEFWQLSLKMTFKTLRLLLACFRHVCNANHLAVCWYEVVMCQYSNDSRVILLTRESSFFVSVKPFID